MKKNKKQKNNLPHVAINAYVLPAFMLVVFIACDILVAQTVNPGAVVLVSIMSIIPVFLAAFYIFRPFHPVKIDDTSVYIKNPFRRKWLKIDYIDILDVKLNKQTIIIEQIGKHVPIYMLGDDDKVNDFINFLLEKSTNNRKN